MIFANPKILWTMVLLAPMIAWYIRRVIRGGAAIKISTIGTLESAKKSLKFYLRHVPFVLVCLATVLIIIALARPQSTETGSPT